MVSPRCVLNPDTAAHAALLACYRGAAVIWAENGPSFGSVDGNPREQQACPTIADIERVVTLCCCSGGGLPG